MVDLSTAECNGKKIRDYFSHGNTGHSLSHLRSFLLLLIPNLQFYSHSHEIPIPRWESHSSGHLYWCGSSSWQIKCRVGIVRRRPLLCGRVCAQFDMPSSKSASVCAQSKRQGRAIHTDLSGNARPTSGVAVGAIPAEKLEGTCGGVDPVRFLPASLPRLPISLHPCFAQFLSFPFKFS